MISNISFPARLPLNAADKPLTFRGNTRPNSPSQDFQGFTKAPPSATSDNNYYRTPGFEPRPQTPLGLKKQGNTDIYYRTDPRGHVELTNKGLEINNFFLYSNTWNNLLATPANQRPHISIFELGAGRGRMVNELRDMGFNAFGIDKYQQGPHIFQRDIREMTSDTYRNQIDFIPSVWAPFSYDDDRPHTSQYDPENTLQFQQETLQKLADWLKPGGKILVSPVRTTRFEQVLQAVPSLEIEEEVEIPVNPNAPQHIQDSVRERQLFVLSKPDPKASKKSKKTEKVVTKKPKPKEKDRGGTSLLKGFFSSSSHKGKK